jgi:RNA polymerase sigma-70 factor (ECF subfamily)
VSPRDLTTADLERLEASADARVAPAPMDEDAFRGFYERTARGVWRFLARATGDRQLADDLLQETYYRFVRAATCHESDAHRRRYLYRIAANLISDTHRRRRTTPEGGPCHDDLSSSVDAARQFARGADLERALGQLSRRERELIWLAYANGSSHREIAALLGLKSGSIRLLLFRARRKLAALLQGARAPRRSRRTE